MAAGLPVVLQDGANTYVYGLGRQLVSQTDGSGAQTYMLADGLGSTRALTDASGNLAATFDYDAFGALRASTGTGATDYRFAGQQDEPALGYQYLRARYYDPGTGRFISRDPLQGLASSPLSQNRYAYSLNDPANHTDPSGEAAIIPGRGLWTLAQLGLAGAAAFGSGELGGGLISSVGECLNGSPLDRVLQAHEAPATARLGVPDRRPGLGSVRSIGYSDGALAWVERGGELRQEGVANVRFAVTEPGTSS